MIYNSNKQRQSQSSNRNPKAHHARLAFPECISLRPIPKRDSFRKIRAHSCQFQQQSFINYDRLWHFDERFKKAEFMQFYSGRFCSLDRQSATANRFVGHKIDIDGDDSLKIESDKHKKLLLRFRC